MDFLAFTGRLHPLIVHLPIGILLFAFALEILSRQKGFRKVRAAIRPALLFGSLSAGIAALTGYILSREGGYDDKLLTFHQYLGIATAVTSFGLFLLWKSDFLLPNEKEKRKNLRLFLFVFVIILLGLTGHLGGSLTHGSDYLSFAPVRAEDEPGRVKLDSISNMDEAILYEDVIQPVLEAKCYGCHSARKQKGQLRLDGLEFIARGGKHGPVLMAQLPDSSTLLQRILMPLETEDHMPPEQKPQLSSAEVDLLRAWIADGAHFDKKIGLYADKQRISGFVHFLQAVSIQEKTIDLEAVSPADPKEIESLRAMGILVMPLSAADNHLAVNFVNARGKGDEAVAKLVPMKAQIVSLQLQGTGITDQSLKDIGQLRALRILNLSNTKISDAGLPYLSDLSELLNLNMVGNNISDKGLDDLSRIPKLQELYLYGTNVSSKAIALFLQEKKSVRVDTGAYQLPPMATDTIVYKRKS